MRLVYSSEVLSVIGMAGSLAACKADDAVLEEELTKEPGRKGSILGMA